MSSAPTDPAFYDGVLAMAPRAGAKPEDLLWVWASEMSFNPSSPGKARTISALTHAVVPSLLTESEWQSLPTLSATEQLSFIERYFRQIHDQYLGRTFQDTFELYLANAAPGLLRRDGQYNAATVMYGNPDAPAGNVWASNWPLDNFPAARRQAALRGVPLSLDFGKLLVSEGVLKGWITLGDLRSFMQRPDVAVVAGDAIRRLRDERAQLQMQAVLEPASYVAPAPVAPYAPDASRSFGNPRAPIDTRVAPAAPSAASLPGLVGLGIIGIAAYLALRHFAK